MENNENAFTNCKKSASGSKKMKKFWTIVITLLFLLIPIGFLFGIIQDRESYREEAVNSVASSWGREQQLDSPELYFMQKNTNGEELQYFTLDNYTADVGIKTEIRKKGIFKVPVYTADIKMEGYFNNTYGNLDNKNLHFAFAVNDSTGFIQEPVVTINNQTIKAKNTELPISLKTSAKNIPFNIEYKIRGLNAIYLGVKGQNNNIKIYGDWTSPEFTGNFLPSSRKVDRDSFTAEWNIPSIAKSSLENPQVGVSLLVPVDNYRMAERTLKYSFLFLALTFICYFIFEITSKEQRQIHPLQYIMLGGAMQIFYLLLVSFSEFIPFLAAYIISAFMIILLITLYTYFVITKGHGKLFSTIICSLMVILYTFLYVLLSLQDLALLIGSLGMFIIIAVIMYTTRNIEWYGKEE